MDVLVELRMLHQLLLDVSEDALILAKVPSLHVHPTPQQKASADVPWLYDFGGENIAKHGFEEGEVEGALWVESGVSLGEEVVVPPGEDFHQLSHNGHSSIHVVLFVVESLRVVGKHLQEQVKQMGLMLAQVQLLEYDLLEDVHEIEALIMDHLWVVESNSALPTPAEILSKPIGFGLEHFFENEEIFGVGGL